MTNTIQTQIDEQAARALQRFIDRNGNPDGRAMRELHAIKTVALYRTWDLEEARKAA